MSKISLGFIPLRKNSKGILGKNKKKLLGRPLFSWVLTEAIFSNLDVVYIFTDDTDIIAYVQEHFKWTNKVIALERSMENAEDTSSTEDAILEFSKRIDHNYKSFCLLQATSPFTTRADINRALEKNSQPNIDSVLSVVNTHRFIWSKEGKSLNYDYEKRPRRQDFDGLLIENGAIYTTSKKALLASGNRLSGTISPIEMAEDSLTEIDSETDWQIAEQLLLKRLKSQKRINRINYLVLDVDGVFTDGRITYGKDGELSKVFDMRDGMGLEILRQHGVEVMVMTSENSELVAQRMKKLQLPDVFLGVKDKFSFLENICLTRAIDTGEIAYVGDDVNDLSNMLRVGWSFCPSNATRIIKNHADVTLQNSSAKGAIREVSEFIMNYNLRFNDL